MDLFVAGCHGGETPRHRTSAFVLDGRLAIDAGALTSGLTLPEQKALTACLVSHAHLDHVRDLATIADNRLQMGAPPLLVVGTKWTLGVLKRHFFNDVLWPDFTRLPTPRRPAVKLVPIAFETPTKVAGFTVRAIAVTHSIECAAFVISGKDGAIAYSGDTGPTDRLWTALNETKNLRALLMEVSFPNGEAQLAHDSGHHTPQSLGKDLAKLRAPKDLPTLLYHIKPAFQAKVERECAKLRGVNLTMLGLGDRFEL